MTRRRFPKTQNDEASTHQMKLQTTPTKSADVIHRMDDIAQTDDFLDAFRSPKLLVEESDHFRHKRQVV